jgi:hypothetical protein
MDERIAAAVEGVSSLLAELTPEQLSKAARALTAAGETIAAIAPAPPYRAPSRSTLTAEGLLDSQIDRVTAEHALRYVQETALRLGEDGQKTALSVIEGVDRSLEPSQVIDF